MLACTSARSTTDYSTLISGRFVMAGASCAGFTFVGEHRALWTNELYCNDPDTLKMRWLNGNTFITCTTKRINPDCPPVVDAYQVVSYSGNRLVLLSIWTGWNDGADDVYELKRQ